MKEGRTAFVQDFDVVLLMRDVAEEDLDYNESIWIDKWKCCHEGGFNLRRGLYAGVPDDPKRRVARYYDLDEVDRKSVV